MTGSYRKNAWRKLLAISFWIGIAMGAYATATELTLIVPAGTELDARLGEKRLKLRAEAMRSPFEAQEDGAATNNAGLSAVEGPGGTAIQFSLGHAVYEGIEPAGSGTVWTVAFWVRPDEPDWGVWQEPWNSKRNPTNMFFFTKPTLVQFGTFLSRAWDIRLCSDRLELHFGDWAAAGTTRFKPGQWKHVAVSRDGDRLAVYVNGQPEALIQPMRVDGATGALLPQASDPLPPLASAKFKAHPSDGQAAQGRFPVLFLGHFRDGRYQDKFIGALGPLTLENRAWTAKEAAAAWQAQQEQATALSRRYSVLSDPVGGRSHRVDKKDESTAEYLKRLGWFRKARYGLFMHWNPSSVAGVEISWDRKTEQNPGGKVPQVEYDALYKQFNPTNYNPKTWAEDAKRGGLRYMVWTVKHHDGFAMWDSRLSSYTVMASPWGKDIVRQYTDALRKAGMRVGLYFSPRDWWWAANRPELTGTPEQKTNMAAYVSGQLGELCTRYGQLDLLWFDGGVGREAEMYRDIIGPKQPRVVTNDRNGPGDYSTPEGQIPSRPLFNADGTDRIWESCIPMGNGGWSYHNDTVEPYDVLIRQMVEVLAKGGNLLRNIGPQPNGEWSPAVRERILQIGEWLKVNGESVYDTHRTRLGWQPWGWATANSNTLFLHVTRWPGRELRLEGLNDHVAAARLLRGGTALEFAQTGNVLTIALPAAAPDPVDTVIALSIDTSTSSNTRWRTSKPRS